MAKNEISTPGSGSNNILKQLGQHVQKPGDTITQEVKPHGNVVTKLNSEQSKVTHRQYKKKDGTLGKQTLTIMQPDK